MTIKILVGRQLCLESLVAHVVVGLGWCWREEAQAGLGKTHPLSAPPWGPRVFPLVLRWVCSTDLGLVCP